MITRYIADLLYHHECVIVPGLGGFIKAYNPAQILHATQEFLPPSVRIAFNAGLTSNDGILLNHITTTENTSYREAGYEIKKWVEACHDTLKNAGKVELEGIGELFINVSGKIEFTPSMQVNFNSDSYGLPSFYARAATSEPLSIPELQPVKQLTGSGKLRRLVPETLKWAAVLAPFIAFTLWGSLNGNLINNYVHNYTGMYSWVRSTPGKTAPANHLKNTGKAVKTADEAAHSPFGLVTGENASFNPGTVYYAELAKNNITIAAPVKTVPTVVAVKSETYCIVGGAFRDQNNAQKQVALLREQGYPASITDTTSGGLFIVSMRSFPDYTEACTQLEEIKKAGFTASWILKRHKG